MPGLPRLNESRSARLATSPISNPALASLISVGQIVLHDTLQCDILRSPIVHLGSKQLSHGQPAFASSRLTLQLRFLHVEPETSKADNLSSSALEYIDARVHLSSSMHLQDGELYPEPLHLADCLAGAQHYERILRGGTGLLEDLKIANENREDYPKPSTTGGFLVRDGGSPVVGMLGAQWIDGPEKPYEGPKRTASRRKHERTISATSVASAPLEPIHEHSVTCNASHWEGEPSGSGTEGIFFHLRPLSKCPSCGINPLQMLHATSKKAATPSSARTPTSLHACNMQLIPNKIFRLVVNLLSYDNATLEQDSVSAPDVFFAHFRVSFYFTDDRALFPPATSKNARVEKGCCPMRRHTFTASIEIGKEGDAQLRQKKEVDLNDALARLEGKGRKIGIPAVPRPAVGGRMFTT
ncbi:MAG: hypothetical protein CYPHOPRED_001174 [Cyphobasidiales sp. Tagirdzhanova-0007]|nr:MAG: hypothetical protein CYPHOPRED_001174 [Cyphobasidiales sp. Tagirdzhanova-0007]